MKIGDFRKMFGAVLTGALIYGVVCAVASVFFEGIDLLILAGLGSGIFLMGCNLILLRFAVNCYVNSRMLPAVLIYVVRILLYGAGAWISYRMGLRVLFAYAVGILGILPGALVYRGKGGIK